MTSRTLWSLVGSLAVAGVVALSAMAAIRQGAASADPTLVSREELRSRIAALPDRAHFGFAGVAFFKGRLYAATNLGLAVVHDFELERFYEWRSQDSVVSGPWLDAAHDSLWIQQAHDGSFLRYDGVRWHRVAMPPPPNGYYSRGNMLTGFAGVSSPSTFWMVGGGGVARADADGRWTTEPQPPMPRFAAVTGIAPIGSDLLYIVNEEGAALQYRPLRYVAYDRSRQWARTELGLIKFRDVVAAGESAYVRAEEGTLLSVAKGVVSTVTTPGFCEAITRTTAGELLAVFKDRGFFVYADGQWMKKAEYPYDASEGEHIAYLAAGDGNIAYATARVPHIAASASAATQWTYSGTDALWVLDGQKFRRISFR